MAKKKQMVPTEEYVVKFWVTNAQGFKEQLEESVYFHSKGKHKQAEQAVIAKYRQAPFNQKIEIISVIYQ